MHRENWFQASPEGAQALGGVHHYVTKNTNLPSQLIHLVSHVRKVNSGR